IISSCQPEMWIRISRTPQEPSQTRRISSSPRPSIAWRSSPNASSASRSSVALSLICPLPSRWIRFPRLLRPRSGGRAESGRGEPAPGRRPAPRGDRLLLGGLALDGLEEGALGRGLALLDDDGDGLLRPLDVEDGGLGLPALAVRGGPVHDLRLEGLVHREE